MIDSLLYPFMGLSALGLFVSLCVHVGALLGIQVLPQPMFLGAGIFVVWFPAILVSMRLVKDFKQKDLWKAALRGCPVWMRKALIVLFAYSIVSFINMILNTQNHTKHFGAPTLAEIRGFTGHFMVFYAASFGILYSAINIAKNDPAPRCPSGHPVPPSANFCEQCGAKITPKFPFEKP